MTASGNGKPQHCVANLLRITRGEVPYERLKGLDGSMIDRPASLAVKENIPDIEWVIKTYKTRVRINDIDIKSLAAQLGHFGIEADLTIE